jgi:hypothetical protein
MTPLVVSSQVNDRVISTLNSEGFRIGNDMILRKRDKPDMLFAEYVSTVFLPHIAKIRSDPKFTHKETVFLMDNCSLHLRQTLADYYMEVVIVPPHTTNIFQCLDLSLFGVLKKKMNSKLPLRSDDSVVAFIRRLFHNLKQTLTPEIVRNTFVHIGVEYNIDVEPYLLICDQSVLRQSSGFLAIWQRDYPLEQLSPRRQRAKFGWVNQDKGIEWNE